MALETGVDIGVKVSGEKSIEKAFASLNKEVERLDKTIKDLDKLFLAHEQSQKKLTKATKEKRTEDQKASDPLRKLKLETEILGNQYKNLTKFSNLSRTESIALAKAQSGLIGKAKELGLSGASVEAYMEGQNRKILEAVRANQKLKDSINEVTSATNRQGTIKVSTPGNADGDRVVALFRANELKKQQAAEKTAQALVEANRKAAKSAESYVDNQLRSVQRELKKVQTQAELTAEGMSLGTASGVARLQRLGASSSQITQFTALRKQIEDQKASDPLRKLTLETEILGNQYKNLAKFSNLSRTESIALAKAQSGLIGKAKELGLSGASVEAYMEGQTKKILETIRANQKLKESIEGLIPVTKLQGAVKKTDPSNVEGNQMVALFRANELKKQQAAEKTAQALVEANRKAAQSAQRYVDNQLRSVQRELKKVQTQAELTAKGMSLGTASGVARLQRLGASSSQIEQFVSLRKQIEALDPAVKKTATSFASLSTIVRQVVPTIGAVGLGSVLTQTAITAIRTADSMSLLRSRMKLTLDSTQDFDKVYQGLIKTSIDNRASLTDTVTLYTRLTPALRVAGIETSAAATVVDSFQKTLLISGATVRETSSAILQFSQAMAAGRLNGDEFRSISEAAPEFLRAFSKATGVAAGALKELSAEGVLTTEVITSAMIVMNDELSKTAKGIDITFGQSMSILGTRLSVLVDNINQTTGFTNALAQATFGASETVKGFTDIITENSSEIKSALNVFGTFAKIMLDVGLVLGFVKGLLFAITKGLPALGTGLGIASGAFVTLRGAILGTATATTALGISVKGLLSSTGIGGLVVLLGVAAVAASDYFFAAKDVTKVTEDSASAIEGESEAREKALVVLKNFGITYGTAGGAAGEYIKRTKELTDEYVKLKVGAEGVYLIEKNLLELKVAQLEYKAIEVALSSKGKKEKDAEIEGLRTQETALKDLLGIMKLTEEFRKETEVGKSTKRGQKKQDSEESKLKTQTDKLKESVEDLRVAYVDLEGSSDKVTKKELELFEAYKKGLINLPEYVSLAEKLNEARDARNIQQYSKAQSEAAVQMNKELELLEEQTKAYKEQVVEIREQTLKVGKQEEALLRLELAKIDDVIATKRQKIEMDSFVVANGALIEEYKAQIRALEDLKESKKTLYKTEEAQKVIEANQKIAKQLEEDIIDAFEKSFLEGANLAESLRKSLKATFAKEVFRVFVQPVVKEGLKVLGIDTGSSSSGSGSITDSKSIAKGFSSFGKFGSGFSTDSAMFSDMALSAGNTFANAFGDSAFTDSILNNSDMLGKVAAGLGALNTGLSVFDSLKGGQYGTAIGEGVGYAFGGSVGAAIGKAIGGFVDKTLGIGNNKISASTLGPEFGRNTTSNLNTQYKSIVESLGGSVNDSVKFNAWGNTGRQGQNPNFSLSAALGGRSIFNSNQTAEGQADGLFLSGEIALNEVNLADQALRSLFAVFKQTDFADNIDQVISRVDIFKDSFDSLNASLADAQLLKMINEEFPKLGGTMATLAGKSIDAVKGFVALAGGFENLQSRQSAYINAVYSEEEKLNLAKKNLQTSFAQLGVSVPKTVADFKALVEAQDLGSVTGQVTYLSLLGLSEAFVEVTRQTDELKKEQQDALKDRLEMEQKAQKEQQDALKESIKLQKELSESMLQTASSIRKTINDILFKDAKPVTQLDMLQTEFKRVVGTALGSNGQALIDAGNSVDSLITEVLGSASEIYASGPEYQRLRDLVFSQAELVSQRLEDLAPLTYQEETISLLQTISSASVLTAQLLGAGNSTVPLTTVQTADMLPASAPSGSGGAPVYQTVIDLTSVVNELKELRKEVAESGEVNIKVVTESGEVILDKTLKQIKDRSKRGEHIIYANGVK